MRDSKTHSGHTLGGVGTFPISLGFRLLIFNSLGHVLSYCRRPTKHRPALVSEADPHLHLTVTKKRPYQLTLARQVWHRTFGRMQHDYLVVPLFPPRLLLRSTLRASLCGTGLSMTADGDVAALMMTATTSASVSIILCVIKRNVCSCKDKLIFEYNRAASRPSIIYFVIL